MDERLIPTGWKRGDSLRFQIIHKPYDYPKHLPWTCALVWLEWVSYIDPKNAPEPTALDTCCVKIQSDELASVNKWLDWWFEDHPENDNYNAHGHKMRFKL